LVDWKKIKEFIFGATVYDMVRTLEEYIRSYNRLTALALFADMLGYPVCNYYRLRLLPHYVPFLDSWKRFMLRETDITDKL